MIFKLVVLDVDGYETYGHMHDMGYFSSFEKAKQAIPKEEDKFQNHEGVLYKLPFYDGILCIIECGIDESQYKKLKWSENEELVESFFKEEDTDS